MCKKYLKFCNEKIVWSIRFCFAISTKLQVWEYLENALSPDEEINDFCSTYFSRKGDILQEHKNYI